MREIGGQLESDSRALRNRAGGNVAQRTAVHGKLCCAQVAAEPRECDARGSPGGPQRQRPVRVQTQSSRQAGFEFLHVPELAQLDGVARDVKLYPAALVILRRMNEGSLGLQARTSRRYLQRGDFERRLIKEHMG